MDTEFVIKNSYKFLETLWGSHGNESHRLVPGGKPKFMSSRHRTVSVYCPVLSRSRLFPQSSEMTQCNVKGEVRQVLRGAQTGDTMLTQ